MVEKGQYFAPSHTVAEPRFEPGESGFREKLIRLPKRNRLGYTQNKTGGILWFSFRMSIARTSVEDLVG